MEHNEVVTQADIVEIKSALQQIQKEQVRTNKRLTNVEEGVANNSAQFLAAAAAWKESLDASTEVQRELLVHLRQGNNNVPPQVAANPIQNTPAQLPVAAVQHLQQAVPVPPQPMQVVPEPVAMPEGQSVRQPPRSWNITVERRSGLFNKKKEVVEILFVEGSRIVRINDEPYPAYAVVLPDKKQIASFKANGKKYVLAGPDCHDLQAWCDSLRHNSKTTSA